MGDYELYHAGVRKHRYIKKIGNRYFYTQQEINAYLEGKKPKTREVWDGRKEYSIGNKGVRVGNKSVSVYNYDNKKFDRDGVWSTKRLGRLKSEYNETGSEHTLDLADRKTYKKRRAAEEAQEKKLKEYQKSQGVESYEERQAKKRKKVKKAISKPIKNLKKQSEKGKKAAKKFYKNNVKPGVTVTHDEAKLK